MSSRGLMQRMWSGVEFGDLSKACDEGIDDSMSIISIEMPGLEERLCLISWIMFVVKSSFPASCRVPL
jgi:hypothetical protein